MPRGHVPIVDPEGRLIGRGQVDTSICSACGKKAHGRVGRYGGGAGQQPVRCDFKYNVTWDGQKIDVTCDKYLCRSCAVPQGGGLDHCPHHAEQKTKPGIRYERRKQS